MRKPCRVHVAHPEDRMVLGFLRPLNGYVWTSATIYYNIIIINIYIYLNIYIKYIKYYIFKVFAHTDLYKPLIWAPKSRAQN